tara:strand:+ start:904 stop:2235 length:1332 start_codon:yes stop_codon:yes gene_type:complete
MRVYYCVFKFVILGLVNYLLNIKKNKKFYLVTNQLLNKFSYRIPEINNYDRLIFFRECKYVFLSLFTSKKNVFIYDNDGDHLILEGGNNYIKQEKKYVNYHHKDVVLHSYISKDNLLSINFTSFTDRIIIIMIFMSLLLPLFTITLISKNRAKISLFCREIFEIILLIKFILKNNIKVVYDFIPYEKDGNFLSICLKVFSVEIFKIPSLGPLKTHNSFIIADRLITSSEYHNEEIKLLKSNFFVSKFENWLPEHSLSYIDSYKKIKKTNYQFNIGFYSHACWLRSNEGKSKSSLFSFEDEIELLTILKEFTISTNTKVVVFPHPKELKEINRDNTMRFYGKYLGGNFKLFENGQTTMNFHKVNIAVSTYSTVVFERLLMGYKSIFYTKSLNDFPISNSSLVNICAKSKDDFLIKLKLFTKQSREDYFELNKMNKYLIKKDSIE